MNYIKWLILWCLCGIGDIVSLVWMLLAIVANNKRAMYIAFGKDQTMNAAIGGHWDEKISSRAWRCRHSSKVWYYTRVLIDWLFYFDPNHCENSHLNEIKEAHHVSSLKSN